jgi:hypothetical protein
VGASLIWQAAIAARGYNFVYWEVYYIEGAVAKPGNFPMYGLDVSDIHTIY